MYGDTALTLAARMRHGKVLRQLQSVKARRSWASLLADGLSGVLVASFKPVQWAARPLVQRLWFYTRQVEILKSQVAIEINA